MSRSWEDLLFKCDTKSSFAQEKNCWCLMSMQGYTVCARQHFASLWSRMLYDTFIIWGDFLCFSERSLRSQTPKRRKCLNGINDLTNIILLTLWLYWLKSTASILMYLHPTFSLVFSHVKSNPALITKTGWVGGAGRWVEMNVIPTASIHR